MLAFRNRTNRSNGGSLESHTLLPPAATTSPFRRKPLPTSGNENSLRSRLKDFAGDITKGNIPRFKKNRMACTPSPWQNLGSNDDLPRLAPADVRDVEAAGQTWPAIRKSISSMASSLRTNHFSVYPSGPSGEASHQSSSQHAKIGFKVSQENARRWVTMATRRPPMATRQTRHSSFSTISEIVSRQDHEPAPQLPNLADTSNFLESLGRTGLFRLFTPPSGVKNTTGVIKVQNIAELDYAGRVRPIVARLPLRLKSPDTLFNRETGYPINKKARGNQENCRGCASGHSAANIENLSRTNDGWYHCQHTIYQEEKFRISDSSRHPVKWLDRVLETSYATRNPISPKLCVSKATMEFHYKSKTCIFVEFPRNRQLPEPLRCYPGFKAALEDICDRFGHFYAPFAAYNAHTRTITLYAMGTRRPENKFIDEDTALFDLWRARSAWVRSTSTFATSTDAAKGASRDTSEDLTEASDHSQAGSEETWATELEDEKPEEPEDPEKPELQRVPSSSFAVDDGDDEDDAVDEDMASRLNFMG
ncbi:hypothetical protein GGR58DRAFT_520908 [Xylaria digitata]|nr:hypothetical protein GGR58DRAFT_520908 [Xylaria digitata]